MPGQVVEKEIVEYLTRLMRLQRSVEIHGLAEVEGEPSVRVLVDGDLHRLGTRAKL